MPEEIKHGLVLADDNKVGSWRETYAPDNQILITFDSAREFHNCITLTEEGGAPLVLLQNPMLDGEED